MQYPEIIPSVLAHAVRRDAFENKQILRAFPMDILDSHTDSFLEKQGVNVWMYHQDDFAEEARAQYATMTNDPTAVSRYFQHTRGNAMFALDEFEPSQIILSFEAHDNRGHCVGLKLPVDEVGKILFEESEAAKRAATEMRNQLPSIPNAHGIPRPLVELLELETRESLKTFQDKTKWQPSAAMSFRSNFSEMTDFSDLSVDAHNAGGLSTDLYDGTQSARNVTRIKPISPNNLN